MMVGLLLVFNVQPTCTVGGGDGVGGGGTPVSYLCSFFSAMHMGKEVYAIS